jgi:L-lactate utilization protein LutC
MRNSALRKVSELDPPIRKAMEKLLERPLQDNETVSVNAYRPHPVPTGQTRDALARQLKEHLDRCAEKVKDVPDAELESAINEALEHARQHPQ